MPELRLGDVIDDFCVKCRRLTNHSIVSMMNASAAKVRCRTCYSDHDYRNEQAPPSKKELARQKELYNAVLSGTAVPGATDEAAADDSAVDAIAEPPLDALAQAAGVAEPPADAAKPATKKKAARKK
jgi:hypothetical protein